MLDTDTTDNLDTENLDQETQTKDKAPKRQYNRKRIKYYELNAKELCEYMGYAEEQVNAIEFHYPLSKKQELFCNDYKNDIVVYGGQAASGKTQVSILRMLIGVLSDKHYAACITRQSKVQLKGSGSIFAVATKVFESAASASTNKVELTWTFPEGQEIKALHLWDNQNDYQGQQNTCYYVDEASQCKEADTMYLMSRLRSKAKMKHQLVLATNPLYDSYLRVFLERGGYLDEEGYVKPEMDGKSVYMARVDGEWVFKQTQEELEDLYGLDVAEDAYSFVFYSAGVDDNPYIKRYLPSYIRKLDNLPELERKMLRYGCWKAVPEASGWFKRDWVKVIEPSQVPLGLRTCRGYDLAGTLPDKEVNRSPDYTRGVKGAYDSNTGTLYILDMVSARDRPAVIQKLIEDTAIRDGKYCFVGLEQDPGAAGIESIQNKKARLAKLGVKVLVTKARQSKFERAEEFLIAAQNGSVVLVKGDWNKAFLDEWESFDGKPKRGKFDDIADATNTMYKLLVQISALPAVRFNKQRAATMQRKTLL